MDSVTIDVSPGELVDKLTILEIKLRRVEDPAKRRNVRAEWALIAAAFAGLAPSPEVAAERERLGAVNEALWDIEDAIRDCERQRDFGEAFVALARAVYHRNDERAAIKRRINETLGSQLVEEKSYRSYL